MSVEELACEILLLREANIKLQNELNETKEHLNKYLSKNKTYYEKNKEKHIENVKKYKDGCSNKRPDFVGRFRISNYNNRNR